MVCFKQINKTCGNQDYEMILTFKSDQAFKSYKPVTRLSVTAVIISVKSQVSAKKKIFSYLQEKNKRIQY